MYHNSITIQLQKNRPNNNRRDTWCGVGVGALCYLVPIPFFLLAGIFPTSLGRKAASNTTTFRPTDRQAQATESKCLRSTLLGCCLCSYPIHIMLAFFLKPLDHIKTRSLRSPPDEISPPTPQKRRNGYILSSGGTKENQSSSVLVCFPHSKRQF